MNTKITTLIFDCFGVVCDPVLNGWYKENRLNGGLIDPNIHTVFDQFDMGKLSEEDIIKYFQKYDGVHSTTEELRKEIDSYLKLDSTLVAIIKKLRQRGFKIALLSNANNSFFERKVYPTYPEFKNLFDEIIISSTVQMIKPNEDIYLYTLEKIDSEPEESLFIDDNKLNVQTALKLGMRGFIYTESTSFVDYITKLGIDLN